MTNKQVEPFYLEEQYFVFALADPSQIYLFSIFQQHLLFNFIIIYINYRFIQIIKNFLSSLLALTLFMSTSISSINLFASLKSYFDSNHSGNRVAV